MTTTSEDISTKIGLNRTRRIPWGGVGAVVLALAAGGYWLYLGGEPAGGTPVYVTEPVSRADIEVTVSAVGTVEPTDLFEISSELSGTIDAVYVDFNDTVAVGTVLARLDSTRLEAERAVQKAALDSAIAQVATADASLNEARATYERGLELKARGVESQTTFIAQEAAYIRAQAELQAARAARALAEANLAVIDVDLDKACICSPVDGIVLDRAVDPGQIVAASLSAPTLFTLAEDLTRMELQVDVDEADIGLVEVGQSATFTVDAHDQRSFPAEIFQIRYASETVDGVVSYKALLSVDNTDLSLRPGMTAAADITVAAIDDALVVPNAALRYAPAATQSTPPRESNGTGLVGMIMPGRPGGNERPAAATGDTGTVYVLRDGAAVAVPVETGESDGRVTEIVSGALAEGDRVITDGTDAD